MPSASDSTALGWSAVGVKAESSLKGGTRTSLGAGAAGNPRATMAVAAPPGPLARKPTEALVEESSHGLRRAVGAVDMTALGLGAIIGTGIFVVIGEAIGKSGPAIVVSFVLAAITCLFSALAYADLAPAIP